ncbi:MAG: hypothetical protein ACI4JY_03480 [Oscillospiraceae bacterium]
MAKSDEEEKRERLELLKMKQGIISESELIPEEQEEQPAPAPLTLKQKIANFFYYYKLHLLIGAAAVFLITFMVVQTVRRDTPDIEVLLVETVRGSGLSSRTTQIERALEQYCPDFNLDGKVHVGVTGINLGVEQTDGQIYLTQMMTFDMELTGESCIVVSDKGFYDYMINEVGTTTDTFLTINGAYSVPVAETALGGILQQFPEDAYVYFIKLGRETAIVQNSEQVLDAILEE